MTGVQTCALPISAHLGGGDDDDDDDGGDEKDSEATPSYQPRKRQQR